MRPTGLIRRSPAEGGALALIEKLLKDAGFEIHRVTFAEPGTDPIDNLYARIGDTPPHLMLAGHTDVVPAGDETNWTHPPFAGGGGCAGTDREAAERRGLRDPPRNVCGAGHRSDR